MSILLPLPRPGTHSPVPVPKRWTCDEFHIMGNRGIFEGRRAFLVEGEIFEMCPGDPPHETSTSIGQRAIEAAFPVSHYVRVKAPLVFGLSTDPEPDLAVVVGDARNYSNAHPETASLVVEVADSSRLFDLKDKANLYAAGKISDYWVIDLQKRRLVVHRDPQPDSEKCFGHGYATVTEHAAGESVKPLLAEKPVAVSDLLP